MNLVKPGGIKLNIKTLTVDSEEHWNIFISKCNNAGVFHTLEWKEIIQKEYGFKPFYLIAEDGNEICGILPLFQIKSVITGNRLVSLPFSYYCGPLSKNDIVMEFLIESAKKLAEDLNCRYLELKMQTHIPEQIADKKELSKKDYFFTSILKLSSDPKENWKKLDTRRTRWAINKAIRSGIEIRSGTSTKDLRAFYDLKVETRKKHGSPTPSFRFYERILQKMEEKNMIKLWHAEMEGKTVASLMFFTYKNTVMPAYIASDEKYNSYMPSNLLYWKAIEWGCINGYKDFDFGRTEPANENLLNFKSKWGTDNYIIPYYYYPYQPNLISTNRKGFKYNLVTTAWKKVPLPVAKLLGPILQKQVG